jgi:hypothetical protein
MGAVPTLSQASIAVGELAGLAVSHAGWIACAALAVPLARLVVRSETSYQDRSYAGSFTAVLFCGVLLASLRPAFAAIFTVSVVFGLVGLSKLKFKHMRMHLHAYDFICFLRDRATLVFLLGNYRALVASCLWRVLLGVSLLCLIWSIEPAAVAPMHAAVGLSLALVALAVARHHAAPRQSMGHFGGRSRITNILETVAEAIEALRRGGVIARRPARHDVPELPRCAPVKLGRTPPNIVLILNESTFPPGLYSSIEYDPAFDSFFRSADGRLRQLRVETFGGGSWMTEFSLLTGIPANSYGSFRHHVFHWATGRIKHSLSQCLKHLGYRIALVFPLSGEFVGSAGFYRSIGFDEILDRSMLGASCDREPDAFYLTHAIEWLTRHFAARDEPAFVFVLTMSNHYPHDASFGESTDASIPADAKSRAQIAEYLRRLGRSIGDYGNFRAELRARFPGREFLLVHFGDHQPPLTWPAFGNSSSLASGAAPPMDEVAYRTYFAVDGVNFRPAQMDQLPDLLEIAYLGTAVLMAAGLPLDSVHAVRRELMTRHSGRLFFAHGDGRIALQLNDRLLDAGLISPH